MKTLYLHIGHYKTGSSAIQAYLSEHADALRATGYLYPACLRPHNNPTNHGCLSLSVGGEHGFGLPSWYTETLTGTEAFDTLRAEIDTAPEPNIIVSSEEFVQLALLPKAQRAAALMALKEGLAGYDVRPVLYLREPFSLMKSWYNQVNKGPTPTRSFPTFLHRVNNGFLSQHRIWSGYAEAFGADAIILRSYRHRGSAHIAEFLRAIGCDHVPPPDLIPVNEAQSLEGLEIGRLQKKPKMPYQKITVTDVGTVPEFLAQVDRICADYTLVAARSDVHDPCQLTAAGIIRHYRDLLAPAATKIELNPAEADHLLTLARSAKDLDLDLARALLEAARAMRPKSWRIRLKLMMCRWALARAETRQAPA